MDFQTLIAERRSVRAYEPGRSISREELEQILRTAQQSPTWKNSQTARCYAVCTPEKTAAVRACLSEGNQRATANCSAYVVTTFVTGISGTKQDGSWANELGEGWGAYDLGAHDAYLVLAARDAGLDSLIMGLRDADALRTVLPIGPGEQIGAVISLGYRAKEPTPRPRRDLSEVAVIL